MLLGRRQKYLLILAVGCALFIFTAHNAASLTPRGSSTFQDEKINPEQFREVGPHLMQIVGDDRRPIKNRVQAAQLLGEIKYMPAIPILVDHIQLIEPEVFRRHWDNPFAYVKPLVIALRRYGKDATPMLVDEWFERTNTSGRTEIGYVIFRKSTAAIARRRARQIAPHIRGTNVQKDLKRFLASCNNILAGNRSLQLLEHNFMKLKRPVKGDQD